MLVHLASPSSAMTRLQLLLSKFILLTGQTYSSLHELSHNATLRIRGQTFTWSCLWGNFLFNLLGLETFLPRMKTCNDLANVCLLCSFPQAINCCRKVSFTSPGFSFSSHVLVRGWECISAGFLAQRGYMSHYIKFTSRFSSISLLLSASASMCCSKVVSWQWKQR